MKLLLFVSLILNISLASAYKPPRPTTSQYVLYTCSLSNTQFSVKVVGDTKNTGDFLLVLDSKETGRLTYPAKLLQSARSSNYVADLRNEALTLEIETASAGRFKTGYHSNTGKLTRATQYQADQEYRLNCVKPVHGRNAFFN